MKKPVASTDRSNPQGRLKLLQKNAEIYRQIVPKIAQTEPNAVMLVVTDPPDPLADVARSINPRAAVLSTAHISTACAFASISENTLALTPEVSKLRLLATTAPRKYFSGPRRALLGFPSLPC
jgi:L-lactate dehydrogenase